MYKILHWLFGWEYTAWSNSADEGVARVHADYAGRIWYWRYKPTCVIDFIESADQVVWLTGKPPESLLRKQNATPLNVVK